MSGRHLRPEGLALLAAGKLGAAERAEVERHLAECAACAEAHKRVAAARVAMDAIGEAPAPELNWERLGARLNWTVSSELRRREREREGGRPWWNRRLLPFALAGVAVCAAAIAVLLWARQDGRGVRQAAPTPAPAPAPVVMPTPQVPAPAPAPAVALEGVVTLLAGDVTLDGAPLTPDSALRAGGRIVTGKGRVGVQFGDKSGFVIEPQSSLTLASFDDRTVELAVDGAVTVELEHRRADQRFAVTAGGRAVEVRGTVFRVAASGGALDVVCTRGRVAVIDGSTAVEVPAGSRLALAKAAPLDGSVAAAFLDSGDIDLRVPTLPGFLSAPTLRAQSAVLAVAARKTARVRVDGVEVGAGPVFVRATPGRHLVEVGSLSRWVEVAAGATTQAVLTAAVTQSERPGQVDEQLEKFRDKFLRCGNRLRKYDPNFTGSIDVEIGVGADGSVNYVSPLKGFSEADIEQCLLSIVRDQFTFPSGSEAKVIKTIQF